MIENLNNFNGFILVVLAGFILDWSAIYFCWQRIKPITKVLAMVLLIMMTLLMSEWKIQGDVVLLLLAQVFGLGGDILLLLSRRWFLWGLSSFLIGHFFYIAILAQRVIKYAIEAELSSSQVVILIVILVIWAALLVWVYPILNRISNNKKFWIGVQVYSWVLSGMNVVALAFVFLIPEFHFNYLFLPIGSFLFLISDSLLSYNRFIKPIQRAQFWVRITYHLAQLSLALGFLTSY
jgi:uncharacterized membrane protein YhhN